MDTILDILVLKCTGALNTTAKTNYNPLVPSFFVHFRFVFCFVFVLSILLLLFYFVILLSLLHCYFIHRVCSVFLGGWRVLPFFRQNVYVLYVSSFLINLFLFINTIIAIIILLLYFVILLLFLHCYFTHRFCRIRMASSHKKGNCSA